MSGDDEGTPLEMLVAGAVTTVTLAVAFGLLAAGVSSFWIVFVVGFAGVLPMALAAVSLYEDRQNGDSERSSEGENEDEDEDALAELRRRYARGELSELEFERRVERLLETETIDDARRYVDTGDDRATAGRERASGRNRTRDQGRERNRDRDQNRNPEYDRR